MWVSLPRKAGLPSLCGIWRIIIDLTTPACRSHLHPIAMAASSVFEGRKGESIPTSITQLFLPLTFKIMSNPPT